MPSVLSRFGFRRCDPANGFGEVEPFNIEAMRKRLLCRAEEVCQRVDTLVVNMGCSEPHFRIQRRDERLRALSNMAARQFISSKLHKF